MGNLVDVYTNPVDFLVHAFQFLADFRVIPGTVGNQHARYWESESPIFSACFVTLPAPTDTAGFLFYISLFLFHAPLSLSLSQISSTDFYFNAICCQLLRPAIGHFITSRRPDWLCQSSADTDFTAQNPILLGAPPLSPRIK